MKSLRRTGVCLKRLQVCSFVMCGGRLRWAVAPLSTVVSGSGWCKLLHNEGLTKHSITCCQRPEVRARQQSAHRSHTQYQAAVGQCYLFLCALHGSPRPLRICESSSAQPMPHVDMFPGTLFCTIFLRSHSRLFTSAAVFETYFG